MTMDHALYFPTKLKTAISTPSLAVKIYDVRATTKGDMSIESLLWIYQVIWQWWRIIHRIKEIMSQTHIILIMLSRIGPNHVTVRSMCKMYATATLEPTLTITPYTMGYFRSWRSSLSKYLVIIITIINASSHSLIAITIPGINCSIMSSSISNKKLSHHGW